MDPHCDHRRQPEHRHAKLLDPSSRLLAALVAIALLAILRADAPVASRHA